MKGIIEFKGPNGPICVPTAKITGITTITNNGLYGAFIATTGEDGWYVKEDYEDAKEKLRTALEEDAA